jgi:hypothetical protein
MQKCSILFSLLFGSVLLVGCAEQPSAPPAEPETPPATEMETDDAGAMEGEAEAPAE